MDKKLKEPLLIPQNVIKNKLGNIYQGIKSSDESFFSFGEAYFSSIKYKKVKGWKKHKKMYMNLLVPVGGVTFFIRKNNSEFPNQYFLGPKNYSRLVIPPGYWFAFRGESQGDNLILNIASIEHSDNEVESEPLSSYPLEKQ